MTTDLEHIFLENSYVLGIAVEPYRIEFRMDFVLTPTHPNYVPPPATEQECYRRGVICIEGFRALAWRASNTRPSIDKDGELDFDCLDEFVMKDGSTLFGGDWGEIEVEGGEMIVRLDE